MAQYGDSSGIGAGLSFGNMMGNNGNNGKNNNNNNQHDEENFFFDGRDGDLRALWSFGVNGFFVPPPEFAGLPSLSTSGTIIPTSAVGLICFDGVGGCALELTAVVGGNLGRQVFNVSMNKIRFISSMCRARISRLGRVVVTAKLAEVSSRLLPMSSLSIPIVVVAQLASRNFAFVEFDQMFVMQGQAIRVRRFDNFLTSNQGDNNNQGKNHEGGGMGGGPSFGGGPSSGGPGSPGNVWGADVLGHNDNQNNNNNNNRNNRFCPNLLDDSQFSDDFSSGRGSYGNGGSSYGGGGFGDNHGYDGY